MARLPTVGADQNNWGTILNEYLQVEHDSAGIHKNKHMFDVRDYGAVMGGASSSQQTTNLAAIHTARDAAVAAGGGVVLINGHLHVNGMVDFTNLPQTTIALAGMGGLNAGSSIVFQGTTGTNYVFSLEGTSYFKMWDLTIDGNDKANYGLYCARIGYPATAGKHSFTSIRVVNCLKASHLNYASEENTYIKCQFQRSPIGVILTSKPVTSDVEQIGAIPCDFGATYQDSTSHFFYDCGIGDANKGTRCAMMIIDSMVSVYGGVFQAKSGSDSEAYIIIDGTHHDASFYSVHLDSGLSNIGFSVGQYSPSDADHISRVNIIGSHLSLNQTTGTSHLKAKNLRNSLISSCTVSGTASVGFDLEDSNCQNNIFENCHYTDGAQITINDASASNRNIVIGRGRVVFLSGSTTGSDPTFYHSGLNDRLRLDGGLQIVPPTSGLNSLAINVLGESAARLSIMGTGTLNFGSGAAATDTTLYRSAADLLRTDDTFQAGDTGAYNAGHLRLGNYHIWVDSTGVLRIKNGAPTTDTDGTVVGSQS